MKGTLLQRTVILAVALFAAIPAMAQSTLRGRIVDGNSGNGMAGALITNTRTGDVAISSNDGAFYIKGVNGEQEITISYLGYADKAVVAEMNGADVVLGDIGLEADAIGVADVVITAGIVTNDRQTPVAVSNVTRSQIEMKLSNQEFPEILKSTPSVYATKESGGYGDSRITMRGFNSENIGVLLNGVPINDMENGRVFWSNWAGLSDMTSFMQVQRGLGASKLALSSVGGTINIVTRSTDTKQGGSVYYGIGNDGLQKLNFNVSTGLLDNGWAFTVSGGRQVGDGYVRGTNFEAWNYFANISKVLAGGRHRLSLTALGSPQWHNQRNGMAFIEDVRTHPDKRRLNYAYGYLNGKIMGGGYGYNEYHKPHIQLVHTWQIDDKSILSTSVYASLARGGGRRSMGPNSETNNWLSINGAASGTGRPYDDTALTPSGHLDFDWVYEQNKNSQDGSAKAILANAVNQHDWYGLMSTFNTEMGDFKLTAGFDGRYYTALHATRIEDLLGADYYLDNKLAYRDPSTPLHEGDLIQYDESSQVLWTGLFAQAEYAKNNLSAFLSGSISGNFYRWHNPGAPFKDAADAGNPLNGKTVSDWVNFLPWSIKGGASYKFGEHHSVFANGGYFTRAPFFNTSFVSYTIETNPEAKVERVTTAELGYQFANNVFNLTFNGYYTLWLDKGLTRSIQGELYNIAGLNARHMGLELEATYRPSTKLTLKAMGSIGDWIWRDDINFMVYDESQNPIGGYTAYLAGVHVGNSAQMTAALGVNWEVVKDLRIGADVNWYGKNFANYEPVNRMEVQDKVDAWQMPDYTTVDMQLSYRFNLGEKISATFYGNVNNLFDTWYIADALDGANHDALSSRVFYGFGRTWTAGLKFNF